jgi:hypothetical protein
VLMTDALGVDVENPCILVESLSELAEMRPASELTRIAARPALCRELFQWKRPGALRMKVPLTSGCQCAKLRYEISETPRLVYLRHCTACQIERAESVSPGRRVRGTSFGTASSPCWTVPHRSTALIGRIVARGAKRCLSFAISRRNRRHPGECRLTIRGGGQSCCHVAR